MFCPYFKVILRSKDELNKYLNHVLREIDLYGKVLLDKRLRVVEIHVGGGTPSLVETWFYRKLAEKLSEYFDVKTSIGIEANPEDFKDYKYVEDLYSAGVEQVSAGVQSFNKNAKIYWKKT